MDTSGERPTPTASANQDKKIDPSSPIVQMDIPNPAPAIDQSKTVESPDTNSPGESPEETAEELGLTEETESNETPLSPEVRQKIRQNEAQQIIHVSISRKGHELQNKKTKDMTESDSAVFGYYFIGSRVMAAPVGRFSEAVSLEGGRELFVSLKGGEYQASGSTGQPITSITEKLDRDGTMFFKCMVNNREVEINASELLNAQLLAEKDNIREALADGSAEQKVLDAQLNFLEDRSSGIDIEDDTMKEATQRTGLLEAEGLRKLIRSTTPEGQVRNERLQELEGQIVASPQAAGELLSSLNTTPQRIEEINSLIAKQEKGIDELRKQIASITDNTEGARQVKMQLEGEVARLQTEVTQSKEEQKLLQHLQEAMPDGEDSMVELVSKIYDGTISKDQSQRINKALQEGKMDELLTELIGGFPEDSEEAKKWKTIAENALKYGGLGAMAILVFIIMRSVGE